MNALAQLERAIWNHLAQSMPSQTLEERLNIDQHPLMILVSTLIDKEEE